MKHVVLIAGSASLLLMACSGTSTTTSSNGVTTSSSLSIETPQATRVVSTAGASFTGLLELIDSGREGDEFQYSFAEGLRTLVSEEAGNAAAEVAPDAVVIFTFGKPIAGKQLVYFQLPEIEEFATAERQLSLLGKASASFSDVLLQELDAQGGDQDSGSTFIQVDVQQVADGTESLRRIRVKASEATLNAPVGSFTYSGTGKMMWDDNIANGNVSMSATFGSNSAATISANNLITPDNLSAGFSGTVAIDNVSGLFSSNSAQITIGDTSIDAGIIGMFNGDASLAGGAVFDAAKAGENVVGVFSLTKD
jgi:hypothetical protein